MGYLAPTEVVNAVNVALTLSQPLFVTGEPGTGKTQLAYAVAYELGLELLRFDTKSNSRGRDLLYLYDALARLHAAQVKQQVDPRRFIQFQALGQAILRASDPETVSRLALDEFRDNVPRQSVVLIDEIDNAPREFANDLLSEIESFRFYIPEVGLAVDTPAHFAPVVVVTSNSERSLPDAFLRRCVYVHIPFPSQMELARIVELRLGEAGRRGTSLIESALDLFQRFRDDPGFRKRPATAELLGWLRVLRAFGAQDHMRLDVSSWERKGLVESTLSALFKNVEDLHNAHAILRELHERRGDAALR